MREERLLDLLGQVDCKYIDEATNKKQSKNTTWLRWCAMAACLVLCICSALAGQWAYRQYHTEVSYLCLDVNPSFELCLNHKGVVINAIAYNEDGIALLDKVNYKNKHYEDVISDIFHHDAFKQYLTEYLTVTVISEDDAAIRQSIQAHMAAVQCSGQVVCSNLQTREKAYSNHCSVGKYAAYEELSQYDQDLTLDDCKSMTMHELYKEIEKHHSEHHNSQVNTGDQTEQTTHSGHHSSHH